MVIGGEKMSESNLVVCIGELLIDFYCTDVDVDLAKGENFIKQAGGAPANVAAAISKLGGEAAFIGKVGNDAFGQFLVETLRDVLVDTTMIVKENNVLTTMAFVSLQSNGERDFIFNRGADERLALSDVDLDKILQAKVIHFGSATALLGGDSLETYFSVMKLANEKGIFISFDPNFRSNLWDGRKEKFVKLVRMGIANADFVKVSDEELKIITKMEDLVEGVNELHQLGGKIISVTLGKQGTFLSIAGHQVTIPSIPVKSIDSTGAGDAFVGATLYQIAKLGNPSELANDFEALKEIIFFANKVGAIVCTKIGAIAALPTIHEVQDY
jgi:fructokinase